MDMGMVTAGMAIAAITMDGLLAAETGTTVTDKLRLKPVIKSRRANRRLLQYGQLLLAFVVHAVARRQFRRALRLAYRAAVVHSIARAELRCTRARFGLRVLHFMAGAGLRGARRRRSARLRDGERGGAQQQGSCDRDCLRHLGVPS